MVDAPYGMRCNNKELKNTDNGLSTKADFQFDRGLT
jgi:hypothetical protein